ncbi:MAG: glycosyltransferase [Anaerolineae bacterium]|nr:glycosyltransferase [Anaerolineae bacterium]
MIRLLYLANARIPTEKAHGLQIMQNCEALADQGAQVTLWAARRVNTPELRSIADPWAHYGVKPNFRLRRVPCLDLQSWANQNVALLRRGTFFLQYATYLLLLGLGLLGTPAEIYYTRDLPTVLLLSLLKSRRSIAYEPHRLSKSGMGRRMQALAVRRAGHTFPVTPHLAAALIELGADPARVQVAHDGIRAARFAGVPDQLAARAQVGWPEEAFIVGYVGRLHTMSMDKGVGTLIQALKQVEGATLALVGGPEDRAAVLRQQWLDSGLPADQLLDAGQVAPDAVPLYLSAFDVCAMPFPWTEHFAYHASPIKLFEYMASGRAIVASDLPAVADVVQDGESALLVPPGDVEVLAKAIIRLRDDPVLRQRLADRARQQVLDHYTWASRAAMILSAIESPTPKTGSTSER